jgi:hypothetical protein
MDDGNRKGEFGVAYVSAIVAAAGYMTYKPSPDLDSIDLGIAAGASELEGAPRIELQVKGYSFDFKDGEEFPYPLKQKNYNELRRRVINPRYLVVVTMPPDDQPWLDQSPDRLVLFRCAYYLSLKELPANKNETTTTVKMPRKQCFTIDALHKLMQEASTQGLFQ